MSSLLLIWYLDLIIQSGCWITFINVSKITLINVLYRVITFNFLHTAMSIYFLNKQANSNLFNFSPYNNAYDEILTCQKILNIVERHNVISYSDI